MMAKLFLDLAQIMLLILDCVEPCCGFLILVIRFSHYVNTKIKSLFNEAERSGAHFCGSWLLVLEGIFRDKL